MPFATRDGYVFEITEILPWIKEHGVHPITGKKLSKKSLIKLKFYKNANGNQYLLKQLKDSENKSWETIHVSTYY